MKQNQIFFLRFNHTQIMSSSSSLLSFIIIININSSRKKCQIIFLFDDSFHVCACSFVCILTFKISPNTNISLIFNKVRNSQNDDDDGGRNIYFSRDSIIIIILNILIDFFFLIFKVFIRLLVMLWIGIGNAFHFIFL